MAVPMKEIVTALMTRFTALTLPAGVGVAYPNVKFTPTIGTPYIRLSVIPNTPVNDDIDLDAEPMKQGLFQVSLFWPDNDGLIAPMDLADTIAAHFARGVYDIGAVRLWVIEDGPTIGGDIQEPSWLQIPITVPWRVYP